LYYLNPYNIFATTIKIIMMITKYTVIIGELNETILNFLYDKIKNITLQSLTTKKKEMFFLLIG
jgi:hypothetical protein